MIFTQFTTKKISNSCTYKSAEHFNGASTKQESKSAAGQSSRKTKCNR